MMNHMAQPSTFDTRDAAILDTAKGAAKNATLTSSDLDAVEFGSGWYHDAAIAASEQAPARKH